MADNEYFTIELAKHNNLGYYSLSRKYILYNVTNATSINKYSDSSVGSVTSRPYRKLLQTDQPTNQQTDMRADTSNTSNNKACTLSETGLNFLED